MYHVYVLKNKRNQGLYYGYTNNLERRTKEHTKNAQWKLIYYEAYLSEKDARTRERKLKQYGQARTYLKTRFQESFKT